MADKNSGIKMESYSGSIDIESSLKNKEKYFFGGTNHVSAMFFVSPHGILVSFLSFGIFSLPSMVH